MKKLKNFLVATAAASALCAAPGCSVKRHYVIDEFDKYYRCEVQFSEDLKSDEIILYEFGEKVAVRRHSVGKDSQGKLEHEVTYEFSEGDNLVAVLEGNTWYLTTREIAGQPHFYFSPSQINRVLQRFYEMQQCEKLLQEKAKNNN